MPLVLALFADTVKSSDANVGLYYDPKTQTGTMNQSARTTVFQIRHIQVIGNNDSRAHVRIARNCCRFKEGSTIPPQRLDA
jgi:hypothetical protein